MFRSFAGIALASAVLTAPAFAQSREVEFGVDVGIRWSKPSLGDAMIRIQTPVDVRVAFHNGAFAIEPRVSGEFLTANGDNVYVFDPGVNILVAFAGSTHQHGGYATAGVDLAMVGGTGSTGMSAVTLNAGLGLRRPMGKAATRAELFVAYTPKQTDVLKTVAVGVRLGISFFN